MKNNRKKIYAAALAMWISCRGCTIQPSPEEAQSEPIIEAISIQELSERKQSLAESFLGVLFSAAPARHGIGKFYEYLPISESEEEPSTPLTLEQRALIADYMENYYESLAGLQLRDISYLFAEPNGVQAAGNRAVLEYLVELRKMQPVDLTLAYYEYVVSIRQGSWGDPEDETEKDEVWVTAVEHSIQNFDEYPEADAESTSIFHQFVLLKTPQGWRIKSHMQLDTLYIVLFLEGDSHNMREYMRSSFPEEKGTTYINQRLETLLREARDNLAARGLEPFSEETISVDNDYDRDAAVAYALEWVGKRNEEWEDYGRYGGNCQNYVSQCLLAGGIPMDPYGDSLWKWYSDIPHNQPGAVGRSASWSGVEEFRQYAQNNTGFGLAAQAGAPYYSGEIGDILELGTAENPLRHAVIITQVIRDEDGNVVDYLVSSNTSDLRNFPASAYFYSSQSLVKILGWND